MPSTGSGSRYRHDKKYIRPCVCSDHPNLCRNVADSVDKKLKEWNDAWFGSKIEMKESKKDNPCYLRTRITRTFIDGLCAIVVNQLRAQPDGFVLLYKRLGGVQGRCHWPRNKNEVRAITWQRFDWLMSGLEIEQPKAIKTA